MSELVTAGAQSLGDAAARVEMSISPDTLRVEVRFEHPEVVVAGVDQPVLGQWTRMLLDALTASWGTGHASDLFLWFEMNRS